MHGQVQLTVADTGPAIACAAVPLALPARGLPRLRCGHTACCEQQVPPVPRTQARPHAPLRSELRRCCFVMLLSLYRVALICRHYRIGIGARRIRFDLSQSRRSLGQRLENVARIQRRFSCRT